jgi:hypothetical protein
MPQSTLAGVGEGKPELDMEGELEGEEKLEDDMAGDENTESKDEKEAAGENVALDRVGLNAELDKVGEGVNSFCSRRGAGGDMQPAEVGMGGEGPMEKAEEEVGRGK